MSDPQKKFSLSQLSRKEKKQLAVILEKAKKSKWPQTAQQTIPYQRMWPEGLCRVNDHYYSKTIQFHDINYQQAHTEDQEIIFESWRDILNYFSPNVSCQLSFVNTLINEAEFKASVVIDPQKDDLNDARKEYSQVLLNQVSKGNNGLKRTKYLTFGMESKFFKNAASSLDHMETDLLNHFKKLGVKAESMNGKERLQVMHDIFHMDDPQTPFLFDWNWLAPTGLSTKDFIAPSGLYFRDGCHFNMGSKIASVSFLKIFANELNDKLLDELLKIESCQVVTIHMTSMDHTEAIKMIKSKLSDLNRSKIDEQKKAVRSGYDIDILPSDLNTYANDLLRDLNNLQNHNERMFLFTFLILQTGNSRKELNNVMMQAKSIAQEHMCQFVTLDYQQEEGLISSLPLGLNQVPVQRNMTTSAAAIFIPFVTQELFHNSREALYYGLNKLTNNLIMADRKKLKTPNGLILGTPGVGKSFSAKREIVNTLLVTHDDIIICDPEGEYYPLVQRFNGQVIRISPTSKDHINPLDINLNYSDDEDPLRLKSDFVLSLCELILHGYSGLGPQEKSIIDRALRCVYRPYFADPVPEKMPILQDLYNELLKMPEPEAASVATALELYVTGSLNVFNHRTNVELDNRLVCFDIKQLGQQLKTFGMLIVQDQVWNRVTINRTKGKTTRYYIDEFHILLRESQSAAYSIEIWKRFRKWGGIPTGITQNVSDILEHKSIATIFKNSEFVLMLNQSADDRLKLAEHLNISPLQLSHITQAGEGEGLLYFDNVLIPFADHFPKDTELYRLMTTKFSDVEKSGDSST